MTQEHSPLLPDRHATPDFFVCDIFDAVPKSDMASMEHPIYSLSTKADHRVRRYENGELFIEVKPGADGLATIHDRDVVSYCVSIIMKAKREGQPIYKTVRFVAYDMLRATNRMTNGKAYRDLLKAVERLKGTQITTNIVTGGQEEFDTFGIIDRGRAIRSQRDSRMTMLEITLSDWMFNAVLNDEVLTVNPKYYRLRKPLEKRIYDIARKHCGHQPQWKLSLPLLQKKCASASTLKEFRRMVGKIAIKDAIHSHLPDYSVVLTEDDMVIFKNRTVLENRPNCQGEAVIKNLSPETYEAAKLAAPGWDVYLIEKEWRQSFPTPPNNPNAAFVGFCCKWFERRGSP